MNFKRLALFTVFILALVVGASVSSIAYNNAQAQDGGERTTPPDIPLKVMVPHPAVAAEMEAQGVTLLDLFPSLDPERSFSFGPKMNILSTRAAPPTPFRTLAILVEFSDNPATAPDTYFDNLLFGTSGATLHTYYDEASYGVLDILTLDLPSTLGWQTAPQTYAYYVNGESCIGGSFPLYSYPNNCQRLAEDLVNAADAAFPALDFSQYDNDGDGWVDTVFIIHAGQGAEFLPSPTRDDHIWSHSWSTRNPPMVDGVQVGSYTTEPEYFNTVSAATSDMTHGVYAHELAHAFGLPDFYDIDYSSSGIGDWGLMGGGSWNGPSNLGSSPALPNAYSREFLEFGSVNNITGAYGPYTSLNTQANSTGAVYRVDSPHSPDEYWLIENRQQTGSDTYLPGSGILIWHIDEDVDNNGSTMNTSNTTECLNHNNWNCPRPNHFTLALEQADGALHLENDTNQGDTGDPFPGSTNNRDFLFTTTPNSSSYFSSSDTSTAIHTISASGPSMTFIYGPALTPRVSINDVSQVEGNAGSTTFTFNVTLDATDSGTITVQVDTADGTAEDESGDGDYQSITAQTVTFLAGDTSETVNVTVYGDTTSEPDEVFYVNLSNPTGNVTIDDGQGVGTILDDEVPNCANPITSYNALDYCINWANVTSPGADTLTLGADIVFTAALTNTIDTAITIDGLNTYALDGAGSYQVLYVTSTGTLTLQDVTVRNGADAFGAGVFVDGGVLNVNGGAFTNNDVTSDGGGIYSSGAATTINGTSFTNNDASNVAGAVVGNGGTLSITGASFTTNTAAGGGALYSAVTTLDVTGSSFTSNTGSAVYISSGVNNTITGCTFTTNTGGTGGALRNSAGTNVTIDTSTFTTNTAGSGGALYNAGPMTVIDSTFDTNSGNTIGGGAIYSFDPLTIDGSTFVDNTIVTAFSYGGGAIFSADTLNVHNSTFSGNTASGGDGGAILIYNGNTSNIRTSTFSGNSATANGSAVGMNTGTGTLNLAGVIMEDGGTKGDCETGLTITDLGYSLSDDASCGLSAGNNTANINLNGLASNGGPTDTHALQPTSAALDLIPLGTTTAFGDVCVNGGNDQRGEPRPNPAGGPCDAGAYEAPGATPPDLSINDVTVTEGDAGTSIAQFTITASGTYPSDITVQVDTANDTATAGSDYVAISAQTATITSGSTTTTVDVTINGDTLVELDETYFVNLSNPVNATITDAQGVGTITDDDAATLSINDVTQDEDAGNQTFTVTLTGDVDAGFSVDFVTADDTAEDENGDGDYDSNTNTLNFAGTDGETQPITITINPDLTFEPDESYNVVLTNVQAGGRDVTISDNTGAGTLLNDDYNCATPILAEAKLDWCIGWANTVAGPQTLTLGANITLTSALTNTINTVIVLEGAGTYYVDGASSFRVFDVTASGDFTIQNATIQNGRALNGGGVYNNGGTLSVTNSTFSGNASTGGSGFQGGGGVYNAGTLTVTGSTFSGNAAGWLGGGIYNANSATVTGSTFSGNTSVDSGAGIFNNATATVTNSTFSNNTATGNGGGIHSYISDTLTVTNSTFSGNSAMSGGGVYNTGTLTLTTSTFSGNSASTAGGGVFNDTGTVHLAGTIFDTGASGANCAGTAVTDNNYNLADDASCAFSQPGSVNSASLNLGALSGVGPGNQVHTPNAGSDAIGAIPNATTVNNNGVTLACNQTTTDQLGADRPIIGGDDCTSGAVEVTPPPDCTTITTEAILDACIGWANSNPGADTLTLGANITLTGALTNTIDTEIVLEGSSTYYVDGASSFRVFFVTGSGNFTIQNATIQNGRALNGGGVYNNGGTLIVTNSTFSGNAATAGSGFQGGGGVYNAGTLTVTGSTFSGNAAGWLGGGIYNANSATVTGSTFSGNTSADSGAGIFNNATTTVTNSTFSNNTATGNGGGIHSYISDTLTVTNSTFSGNSALNGGGVYNGGTLTLTTSTFSGNSASTAGGGVFNDTGTVHLAGTIFDTGASGANCAGTAVTDNNYNLADDASCAFSQPGSVNSASLNLGGLTGSGPGQQVHIPAWYSEAIGAIPNPTSYTNNGQTLACGGATTDQLGNSRPLIGGDFCTSGAVEVTPPDCTAAITDEDTLDYCIEWANTVAGPQTLTLGANITLTGTLTNTISTQITLDGQSLYYVDGASSYRVFFVTGSGNFTIQNATIQNGRALNGGGVYNNGGTLSVTNSTFSGNASTGGSGFQGGGGVYNAGTLTVTGSTFSGNAAGWLGGGIYNANSATVTGSTFSGNTSADSGAGIFNNATATVTNSTFSNNTASGNGGGIHSYISDTLTVTNSTFSGNSAMSGGGVYNGGTLTLTTSTFSGNSASTAGGGVFNDTGTVHLAGTIFDTGASGANCAGTAVTDNNYNLADDASCAFSQPGSVNSASLNLGGLTGSGPGQQVHTPLAGSDAIGAIPNTLIPYTNNGVPVACNGSTSDQLGNSRPLVGGDDCAAGALEVTPYPELSIDDVWLVEGDSGTAIAQFIITASGTYPQDITVQVDTANDTATTADSDYVAISAQTATITSGSTTTTVDVTINGDATVELDETYFVNLSNPTNATIADAQGVGTITNDDSTTLSINDVSQNEDAGNQTFTVSLTNPVDVALTMSYSTTNGTATTADSDYTGAISLPFNIPAGSTSNTFNIAIGADNKVEADETYTVDLSGVVTGGRNVTLGDTEGQGTILNDDSAVLSISNVSELEGDSGTTTFVFDLTLSNPVDATVGVDTIGNSHVTTESGDFIGIWMTGGIDLFAPGVQAAVVNVPVVGDTLVELDEDFTVDLSGLYAGGRAVTFDGGGATLSGTGTILNDDSATISIDDVAEMEGTFTTTDFVFTVTLTGDVDTGVDVDFMTADVSATSPGDYAGQNSTLNFAGNDGETQTITISIETDPTVELDEQFTIYLTGITAGGRDVTFSDDQGSGTIINDDSATLSIDDVTFDPEGNTGGPTNATFTVSLTGEVDSAFTIDFTTADGTASFTSDYIGTSNTLNFSGSPGEWVNIQIPVIGDTMDEFDENFFVNLSNIQAGGRDITFTDAQGEGTIVDDDAPPTLSINDVTLDPEGDVGTPNMDFTVSLSAVSGKEITVLATTADGTATTADSDYQGFTDQLVVIPAGDLSFPVTVLVFSDTKHELNETFTVTLSSPTDATIADGTGLGTIVNDDNQPTISIADAPAQNEGDAGMTAFYFTVMLSNPSYQTIDVTAQTADGTATVGDNDYGPVNTLVSFPTGDTSVSVQVNVNGDIAVEPDETFSVTLSSPANATIADGTGTTTILNDDALAAPYFVWTGGPVVAGCNVMETQIPLRIENFTPNAPPGYTFEMVVFNGSGEYYMDQTFTDIPTGPSVDFTIYLFDDHTMGLTPVAAWPMVPPVTVQAQLWDGTHTTLYSTFTMTNYDCTTGTFDPPTIVP